MLVKYKSEKGKRMISHVVYTPDHSTLKWKKICVRSYEMNIMKKLDGLQLSQRKKVALARAMSYYPAYPGTSRRTIVKNGFEKLSQKFGSDASSDTESESTYLFKDLPTGPKRSAEVWHKSEEEDEARIWSPNSQSMISPPRFQSPESLRSVTKISELVNLSPSLSKLKVTSSVSTDDSISELPYRVKVPFLKLGKVSKSIRGQSPFLYIGSIIFRMSGSGARVNE